MDAIFEAIEELDVAAAKAILAAEPQVRDACDAIGDRPLHQAAGAGLGELVELLIASGADVNARGDMQRTPLHYAAREAEPAVAAALIAAGAETAPVDAHGLTPLFYAVQGSVPGLDPLPGTAAILLGRNVAVDLLSALWLYTPEDLDRAFRDGKFGSAAIDGAAIDQAVIRGDLPIVEILLRVNPASVRQNSARLLSSASASPAIAEALLKSGADPNAKTSWGSSLLADSTRHRYPDAFVEVLRKYGAS